jgi:succinate dehydrogenase flavin-adding protein (antitoxin of CptAB toxin-antitoxin module)
MRFALFRRCTRLSDEYEKSQRSTLNVELEIEDEQLMNWAKDNYPTIKDMFTTILNGLYSSRPVIDKVD